MCETLIIALIIIKTEYFWPSSTVWWQWFKHTAKVWAKKKSTLCLLYNKKPSVLETRDILHFWLYLLCVYAGSLLVWVLLVLQQPWFLANFLTFPSVFIKMMWKCCKLSNSLSKSNIKHPQFKVHNENPVNHSTLENV